MRTRPATDTAQAIGTDAFLDIVANLVGILLILIMVIGVRMDDASQNASKASAQLIPTTDEPHSPPSAPSQPELPPVTVPDVEPARLEVQRLEMSIRGAESEATQLSQTAELQKMERDDMMLAVTMGQRELERRRAELDQRQQAQLDVDLELDASREQYQGLVAQLEAAQTAAAEPAPEVIQHIATPLAKTVFLREEHFRLKQGRLSFVPLNSMTEQLRSEARKKIWKLENTSQITETIGPRDGFYLRYTLRRHRVPVSTGAGLTAREVVELDRFVMIPVGNLDGESIDEARHPDSDFRRRLARWSPRETIVTIWTYPDSYADFRDLKRTLYELGFLTAARPLPDNQLISGSPSGTRSAAQ